MILAKGRTSALLHFSHVVIVAASVKMSRLNTDAPVTIMKNERLLLRQWIIRVEDFVRHNVG